MSATGYVWETTYGWADLGTGPMMPAHAAAGIQPITHHVAHPDTKRRMHELISATGLIDSLTPVRARPASREDILRVHEEEYYDRIAAQSLLPKGGDAGDGETSFGQGGLDIALLAAGGALAAVDAVVSGVVENCYALVNPPGHHAERNMGRGYCLFGNTAVAAAYAREQLGISRVAIVDWDVHHGNGTQDIFWERDDVLNISIHQNRCFPTDSGFVEERGAGAGEGYTINVPLPPGGGMGAYEYAFDTVVIPALRRYAPELIIVGSGFDASIMDPLARMMLRAADYATLTRKVMDLAAEVCDGRLVCVQEGGYNPFYLPFCGLKVLEELSGVSSGIDDAFAETLSGKGGEELMGHEREAVDHAARLTGLMR